MLWVVLVPVALLVLWNLHRWGVPLHLSGISKENRTQLEQEWEKYGQEKCWDRRWAQIYEANTEATMALVGRHVMESSKAWPLCPSDKNVEWGLRRAVVSIRR